MFKVKNITRVKKINDMLRKENKHNNKMLRTQLEAIKENTYNLMVENFENPKVYEQLSNDIKRLKKAEKSLDDAGISKENYLLEIEALKTRN
mgnify:CR=1 FL=1|tara:strand:+ start:421 stop:696 length:276 start_codon:yes stop_codon:yes gene_type:complete